jgi:hypothetical protein
MLCIILYLEESWSIRCQMPIAWAKMSWSAGLEGLLWMVILSRLEREPHIGRCNLCVMHTCMRAI